MGKMENLVVWTKAIALSKLIYLEISQSSNLQKDFWLRDQIQRSCVSIASNIAEWNDRETHAEFKRFLYIARGSCAELKTQIIIAFEIWYITELVKNEIINNIEDIHRMINAFINTLKT